MFVYTLQDNFIELHDQLWSVCETMLNLLYDCIRPVCNVMLNCVVLRHDVLHEGFYINVQGPLATTTAAAVATKKKVTKNHHCWSMSCSKKRADEPTGPLTHNS
jgi:hypothetical protein